MLYSEHHYDMFQKPAALQNESETFILDSLTAHKYVHIQGTNKLKVCEDGVSRKHILDFVSNVCDESQIDRQLPSESYQHDASRVLQTNSALIR